MPYIPDIPAAGLSSMTFRLNTVLSKTLCYKKLPCPKSRVNNVMC